jgi:cell wall-associated NlpC family hydrolase
VAEDDFAKSIGDIAETTNIKPVGEGVIQADYQWGWEAPIPDTSTQSLEDIWNNRSYDVETETTGDLGVPSGRGGDTDYVGGSVTGGDGLVKMAMKFIGTPYKWGGNTPLGFDCSGFTSYVYKNVLGITLPRISYQQGTGGQGVSRDQMKPGDLVFWDNSSRNNGADHVGIYIGGGKFVAAPQPGSSVKVSNLYGNYWARRYR